MKHLLATITVALGLTSCLGWVILGPPELAPLALVPTVDWDGPAPPTGPLGVHKGDELAFASGNWVVVAWDGRRIDLEKGSLSKSINAREAKQAPDFDWLYESPEGRFSVGCPHHDWR